MWDDISLKQKLEFLRMQQIIRKKLLDQRQMNGPNLQSKASHPDEYQINGKSFKCYQSMSENKIVNGVDLAIKQVKGLSYNVDMIDFLPESHQIIFTAAKNIFIYNTFKREYNQLISLDHEPIIIRGHFQKMNNKEYILWVQKQIVTNQKVQCNQKPMNLFSIFATNKGKNIKRQPTMNYIENQVPKTTFVEENEKKKVKFLEQSMVYGLNVYDFTKKQLIFNEKVKIRDDEILKDIFIFNNSYKIVGYITQNKLNKKSLIYYKMMNKNLIKETNNLNISFLSEQTNEFSILECSHIIQHLQYNNEQSSFIFKENNKAFSLFISKDQPDTNSNISQYPKQNILPHRSKPNKGLIQALTSQNTDKHAISIRLEVEQIIKLQEDILCVTMNDFYIAFLTHLTIYCYSAFQSKSQRTIITYDLKELCTMQGSNEEPMYIQFSKNALLLTYKDSSKITSLAVEMKVLKFMNTTKLEISHCKEIIRIYTNNLSSQIFCLSRLYELEGRMNSIMKSRKVLEASLEHIIKPVCIDVSVSYLTTASKSQTMNLGIANQKFKKIHTCPWLAEYFIETDNQIQSKSWKESFQNKKCTALHPTGLFMVIGFKDNFKIYVLTYEGLINTFKGDSLKDLQCVCVNDQGNNLALATNSTIIIYDFYTCSKIKTLNLPFGVMIDKLEYQGSTLICVLKSKKIYSFDLIQDYKQVSCFNLKTIVNEYLSSSQQKHLLYNLLSSTINSTAIDIYSIHSYYYDFQLSLLLISAKETLYFFNCLTQSILCHFEFASISCFYYSKNLTTLFMGTTKGEVISFVWPNKPTHLLLEHKKYKYHSRKVIDIKVSSDLKELITMGEDESLYISTITFIRNLKNMMGLEIIDNEQTNMAVGYDILTRKGFTPYSLAQSNDKNDLIKDFEDEVMNLNFIIPEERIKQKEHMIFTIEANHQGLTDHNQQKLQELAFQTTTIRNTVNTTKDQINHFHFEKEKEKACLLKQLNTTYMNLYEETVKTQKKKILIKNKLENELQQQKNRKEAEVLKLRIDFENQILKLEQNLRKGGEISKVNRLSQLQLIEDQKQQLIKQQISSINVAINEFNISNGIFMCKNNNLISDIDQYKQKIEENNFMIYRIQTSTEKLEKQKLDYQISKELTRVKLSEEDKINLTQTQKRYVKQTQNLIEKDKQISNKIQKYSKEQKILITIQKAVEVVQGKIQELVEKNFKEKQEIHKDTIKTEEFQKNINYLSKQLNEKKQKYYKSKREFKDMKTRIKQIIFKLFSQKIQKKDEILEYLKIHKIFEESKVIKQVKNQQFEGLIFDGLQKNINNNKNAFSVTNRNKKNWQNNNKDFTTKNNQTYRNLQTEMHKSEKKLFNRRSVNIEKIENKTKNIIFKITTQERQYEHLKRQQIIYENSKKRLNFHNEDLLNSYNALYYDNKKLNKKMVDELEPDNKIDVKVKRIQKRQNIAPTPFQNYIKIKQTAKKRLKTLPCAISEY